MKRISCLISKSVRFLMTSRSAYGFIGSRILRANSVLHQRTQAHVATSKTFFTIVDCDPQCSSHYSDTPSLR